jgi:ABC-type glycerol-3-phosphate transport system substrate-binding protein
MILLSLPKSIDVINKITLFTMIPKKLLIVIIGFVGIIALLFVPTLLGIGKKDTVKIVSEKGPISIWSFSDKEKDTAFDAIVGKWNTDHPNTPVQGIRYFTDKDIYERELLHGLASGNGPDVFVIHDTELITWKDKLTPAPQTLITSDIYRQAFIKSVSQRMITQEEFADPKGIIQKKESVWGIPLISYPLTLWYNKALFGKYVGGYSPSNIWASQNQESSDIISQSQGLSKINNNTLEQVGIHLSMSNINNILLTTLLLLLQDDIIITNEQQNAIAFQYGYDNQKDAYKDVNNLLEFLKSFQKQPYRGTETDKELFAVGKLAMMFGTSHNIEEITKIKALKEKQIQRFSDKRNLLSASNMIASMVPQKNDGDAFNISYSLPYVVSKQSKLPNTAWNFVDFLSTTDIAKEYAIAHQTAPVTLPAIDYIIKNSNNKNIKTIAKSALSSDSISLPGDMKWYEQALRQIFYEKKPAQKLIALWQCILDQTNKQSSPQMCL